MATLNLSDKWALYAHLPHDKNWDLSSYIKMRDIVTSIDIIKTHNTMPDFLFTGCMLFLMKNNIKPRWEDPNNKNGGCFSFKIQNNNVITVWKRLTYYVISNEISQNEEFCKNVTGITISPKKNFCIIKIWMRTAKDQDPSNIVNVEGLNKRGCLFKKHTN